MATVTTVSGVLLPLQAAEKSHIRSSNYLPCLHFSNSSGIVSRKSTKLRNLAPIFVSREEISVPIGLEEKDEDEEEEEEEGEEDAESLEYIAKVKNVLELLKKNRDMLFNEVKLTIMIEDPRDVERRRLLGIDDENAPTRDELAEALVQVNEGKIPRNRDALRLLAEEMSQWPNLDVDVYKKKPKGKSLYERFTDTGVDIKEAAKRLNVDWDRAAEIEDAGDADQMDVPPAIGYSALYLVTAFPVIIGISVVLILFYNSLQ